LNQNTPRQHPQSMQLDCKSRVLDLTRPIVMGILNVTPDSFSDGGRYLSSAEAIARAHEMVEQGAEIIDIGGESTRPGAQPVTETEEMRRVIPVIDGLAGLPAVISIDTSKPSVMRAACAAGASFINDVNALRAPGALEVAADCAVPVCLMHMQGEPRTMQQAPHYTDVVTEVRDFLNERVLACTAAGISRGSIVVDPGFGFGKTLAHNLALLGRLDVLASPGLPLLVGVSRKSMLGAILGTDTGQRLSAGVAAAVLAVWQGARIVRTHDVPATVDALRMTAAVMPYRN
jgi:dihydropteroate synthase